MELLKVAVATEAFDKAQATYNKACAKHEIRPTESNARRMNKAAEALDRARGRLDAINGYGEE